LSAYPTAANQLRIVTATDIKDEAPTVKSFTFKDRLAAKAAPGQFVMIWVPQVDEVPMSLSTINSKEGIVSITVEKVGEATRTLHRMKVGDSVGIRGPFGRGYMLTKKRNVMIVGGGTGVASLAPLAEKVSQQKGSQITFLLGAGTRSELLFLKRIENLLSANNHQLVVTTEDASFGNKGLITQPAEQLLLRHRFDVIYACGPEMMMHKMLLLSERFKVPFQASLERLMRCAIGICGTCVIGKYRVCKDGPVFSGEQLSEVKQEFGHFTRGFNSKKIPI